MPENLLILLVMLFIATASYADKVDGDDSILSFMGPNEEILVDDEELPESLYQYPGLVEKVKTERYAAKNPYLLLPHKPNYFMPLSYQTKINQEEQEEFYKGIREADEENGTKAKGFENTEFVFQISVKYMVAKDILGKFSTLSVAYTGKSFWQAYNKSVSALFRETNHEPEIILGLNPKFNWSDHMTLAFNHQSNGQIGNLSRSWNRIIISTAKVWPDRILNVRAWYRIPEEEKETPSSTLGDDNPDILKYMGYGDIFYLRKIGEYSVGITARNNLRASENLGSIELDWNFPLPGGMKGFIQYFNGYGESLIDYDQYQERIGVGIKISDWL